MSLGIEIETGNGTFLGVSPRRMSDAGTGDDDMMSGKTGDGNSFLKPTKIFLAKYFMIQSLLGARFNTMSTKNLTENHFCEQDTRARALLGAVM